VKKGGAAVDSFLLNEILVEIETRPPAHVLRAAAQRMEAAEHRPRTPVRARLARAFVALGLWLDAGAGRALAPASSR